MEQDNETTSFNGAFAKDTIFAGMTIEDDQEVFRKERVYREIGLG